MDDADPIQSSFSGKLIPYSESQELLNKAQVGDGDALNQLLERYQGRLRRIVRSRLGMGISAYLESMDIVQNTYQVALRKIATLEARGPGSILDWLARIAEHQITDAIAYHRAQKRDRGRELGIEGDPADSGPGLAANLQADTTLPEERAARGELRDLLDRAINELSEDQREAIVLKDYCGGSWEEVAERLARNVPAVQELHRRARIKLSRKLGPALGDDA